MPETVRIEMDHRNYQIGSDQTGDIAMTIEDALKERQDIVAKLTNGEPDAIKMLRELSMGIYVRGFFAGMRHTMMDQEEKAKEEAAQKGETPETRNPCRN